MWTLTEPDLAHALTKKYTDTAINGAEVIANKYGMAMISTGSVLGNNDIFSDQAVLEFSMRYLKNWSMRRSAKAPDRRSSITVRQPRDRLQDLQGRLIWSPFTIVHVGYKGRRSSRPGSWSKEFGKHATIMGSVDTKIMINPNPKAVYDQASGRSSRAGQPQWLHPGHGLRNAAVYPAGKHPGHGEGGQGPRDLWHVVKQQWP